MDCDVVIVGCGVAGLYAALNLPATSRVVMLSKGELDECDSMLAQGGICVLPEGDDYDSFFEDTMRAGHFENRRESVDIMIRSSRSVINDLVALGVEFNREADGSLAFTREGAHARPRIAFYRDVTGKAITSKLLERVQQLPNVEILDHTAMIDLLVEEGGCRGVVACPVTEEQSVRTIDELMPEDVTAPAFEIHAGATLLATGGIGGVYQHSTNFPQLTGDAVYLATKYGLETEHLDYVQIHPTGLYSQRPGRTFLISESCRGEGAVLLNQAGERFVDELQPRDVVAAAIREQMRADGSEHEWLSFAPVDPAVVREHFVNIRQRCLEDGRDILDESIPVVPTQHYFMGGVRVDRDSATSMPRLYAAGETSCNGVHGRNRLASNSLLEALVFARRAAYNIATGRSLEVEAAGEPALDGAHRATGFDASIDRLCAAPAISVPSASEPVSPARGESSSK
ncbi:L-aspartate oxidase [Collinsella tanakaei]|uniref:L-aspartate oxidase n=1 Tax=Collinsella tanakaei TaxID=626935 RepID=UPI0039F54583